VVLESDIGCSGLECTLQDLQTFEVAAGANIFFEYIRPPCVNHAFYENAKSIRRRKGDVLFAMCGDVTTQAASTACCSGTGSMLRDELFSGERVTFDVAETRCGDRSESLCEDPFIANSDCTDNSGCDDFGMYYWSSLGCSQVAKINLEGMVAMIHQPQIEGVATHEMVAGDSQMYFRVDWQTDDVDQLIANLTTDCSMFGCFDGENDTCLCDVEIQDSMVFTSDSDVASVADVLSQANIAATFPARADIVGQTVNGIDGLLRYPSGDGFTEETVFEVKDQYGRIEYRKNMKSIVSLGNGVLSFRNPVTFYSLSQPTIRDASYETDAALEHAFHHQNIAPFLAIRLAQRFGVSNPSPRYVTSISRAFRSGIFKDSVYGTEYGSGKYGCLKATIAATLLDRESKEVLLDADPVQ
jgi:Protein of unknown function (DUF1800)